MKNMITKHWEEKNENEDPSVPLIFTIHEQDRHVIREHIIDTLALASEPIRLVWRKLLFYNIKNIFWRFMVKKIVNFVKKVNKFKKSADGWRNFDKKPSEKNLAKIESAPVAMTGKAKTCSPNFCSLQLCTCIQQILREDFPAKWPNFADKVMMKLEANDGHSCLCALLVLHRLVKIYELVPFFAKFLCK